jgi:CheY-like chemotaxis protein
MRVLLVEEDIQIGESLLRALKGADCSVDWVRDGKAGSVAINTAYYAVVLLDPGLSGAGGIDLLRSLRAAGNDVAVLILTARLRTQANRSPRTSCANPGGIAAQGGLRNLAYRLRVAQPRSQQAPVVLQRGSVVALCA